MAQIEGIETIRNAAGEITYVTIDVQKQQAIAAPVLKQLEEERKAAFHKRMGASY